MSKITCSIISCGKKLYLGNSPFHTNPSPYCEHHFKQYREEFEYCRISGCWELVPLGSEVCGEHGNTYTPRTHDSPECTECCRQRLGQTQNRCWEHRYNSIRCLTFGCFHQRVRRGENYEIGAVDGSPFCAEHRKGRDIAGIHPVHTGGTVKEIPIPTPEEFTKTQEKLRQEKIQAEAEKRRRELEKPLNSKAVRDALLAISDKMRSGKSEWELDGKLYSGYFAQEGVFQAVCGEMLKRGWILNLRKSEYTTLTLSWEPRKVQTPTPTPVDTEEKFWHYPTFVGRVCVSDPDLINKTPESPRLPLVGSIRPDNFGEYLQEYWCFIYRDHNLEWHVWRGPSENIFRDNPMPALAGILDIYQDKFSGVGYLHSGDGGVYTIVNCRLPSKEVPESLT